jgi:SAM-dependent methyltransferase
LSLNAPRIPPESRGLEALRARLLERADDLRPPRRFPVHPGLDLRLSERRLAEDHSEAATLARLFGLCVPVPVEDAERALAPVELDVLEATGLASVEPDLVRPLARIAPNEGLLIACDPLLDPDRRDFVTGPSPAGRRVDRLTIRRPVRTALDLGTGSGLQALRAANHSERVVGVDVNERALAFARFNASLNGVSNLDLRAGSWFEPVDGERFDLVVANPPYVVSPETALLYRDGDLPADAVTQKLLLEVPAYLEEGGFAHVMGNWIHGREEDWRAPVERWLAGSGCDALLLRYGDLDLVSYAAHWNLQLAAGGAEPLLAAVDRWLDYYRSAGIEAISEGMVLLRRRSGVANWVRAIEVPGNPTGPAGDHVIRLFEARDRRDEAALSTRFKPAPGLKPARSSIEVENGVGFSVGVPPDLLDGLSSPDLDPRQLETARRLFALGLLELP